MRTRELTGGLALLTVCIYWAYQMMFYMHSLVS
jgi:hypothetical protein